MKFKLEIELGNDAVRDGADITHLLREVAESSQLYAAQANETANIRDINGNTVGSWEFTGRKPPE